MSLYKSQVLTRVGGVKLEPSAEVKAPPNCTLGAVALPALLLTGDRSPPSTVALERKASDTRLRI